MDDMKLPYLSGQTTRHGKTVWYVRRNGLRVRLRVPYGGEVFMAEYRNALAGVAAPVQPKAQHGTLQWLWDQYRQTVAWQELSSATRKQRENILRGVLSKSASAQAHLVKRSDIAAARDARASTPAQARNFLDAMRGLFRWALEAQHITIDPTAGVKNPKKVRGAGFPVWSEDEVDRYQAHWPLGTRERVWLDVLLYTGLRRGDAVKLGRQHVRDGVWSLRTEKSRGAVTVANPLLPILARTLAAGPTGDLAFICGANGKPLTKESFGNLFREACNAAGVKKSAHGLRKAGATRAAENGATVAELEALFGWVGGGMASLYTRDANRRRLSEQSATKMERKVSHLSGGTVSPSTETKG